MPPPGTPKYIDGTWYWEVDGTLTPTTREEVLKHADPGWVAGQEEATAQQEPEGGGEREYTTIGDGGETMPAPPTLTHSEIDDLEQWNEKAKEAKVDTIADGDARRAKWYMQTYGVTFPQALILFSSWRSGDTRVMAPATARQYAALVGLIPDLPVVKMHQQAQAVLYGGGAPGARPAIATEPVKIGDYTVSAEVYNLVSEFATNSGVPFDILMGIVLAESGGDATNDTGDGGYSVGLLQLYNGPGGGQGSGMTVEERQDPRRNLEVGIGPIAEAYRAGVEAGLTGDDLVTYVAAHSGHPTNLPSDAADAQTGYANVRRGVAVVRGSGVSGGGGGIAGVLGSWPPTPFEEQAFELTPDQQFALDFINNHLGGQNMGVAQAKAAFARHPEADSTLALLLYAKEIGLEPDVDLSLTEMNLNELRRLDPNLDPLPTDMLLQVKKDFGYEGEELFNVVALLNGVPATPAAAMHQAAEALRNDLLFKYGYTDTNMRDTIMGWTDQDLANADRLGYGDEKSLVAMARAGQTPTEYHTAYMKEQQQLLDRYNVNKPYKITMNELIEAADAGLPMNYLILGKELGQDIPGMAVAYQRGMSEDEIRAATAHGWDLVGLSTGQLEQLKTEADLPAAIEARAAGLPPVLGDALREYAPVIEAQYQSAKAAGLAEGRVVSALDFVGVGAEPGTISPAELNTLTNALAYSLKRSPEDLEPDNWDKYWRTRTHGTEGMGFMGFSGGYGRDLPPRTAWGLTLQLMQLRQQYFGDITKAEWKEIQEQGTLRGTQWPKDKWGRPLSWLETGTLGEARRREEQKAKYPEMWKQMEEAGRIEPAPWERPRTAGQLPVAGETPSRRGLKTPRLGPVTEEPRYGRPHGSPATRRPEMQAPKVGPALGGFKAPAKEYPALGTIKPEAERQRREAERARPARRRRKAT